MTAKKIIPLPKLSEIDEQFLSLEKQARLVRKQKKLIQDLYK